MFIRDVTGRRFFSTRAENTHEYSVRYADILFLDISTLCSFINYNARMQPSLHHVMQYYHVFLYIYLYINNMTFYATNKGLKSDGLSKNTIFKVVFF